MFVITTALLVTNGPPEPLEGDDRGGGARLRGSTAGKTAGTWEGLPASRRPLPQLDCAAASQVRGKGGAEAEPWLASGGRRAGSPGRERAFALVGRRLPGRPSWPPSPNCDAGPPGQRDPEERCCAGLSGLALSGPGYAMGPRGATNGSGRPVRCAPSPLGRPSRPSGGARVSSRASHGCHSRRSRARRDATLALCGRAVALHGILAWHAACHGPRGEGDPASTRLQRPPVQSTHIHLPMSLTQVGRSLAD